LKEQDFKACFSRRAAPDPERIRLIIACRQDRERGTGRVIESLPLILKDFPQAALDVVGDGDALTEFKGLAATLGVSERITFHGKVDHPTVMRLFRQADLFCYPTAASEGFPKVVLEALACGLPVVTTRVSVLPELISNGCGLLLEDSRPEMLAQAVRAILADADDYRAMSARAAAIAQQYSLEHWGATIGQMLRVAWGRPLRSYA
jgi:glycosyltransferase involved in cell wall biosynthesis